MHKNLRPVSLAVLTLIAGIALNASAQETRRSYIVQLPAPAAASYDGGIAGLPATKPAPGTHLDVTATDVQNYISYLNQKQDDVLITIDPANITARYDVALNGFAAMLTDSEVRALKKNSNVLSVQADEIHHPYTSNTPTFLGLDQPGGLWDKVGGKANAGEGMIIAMIDSGVWPEDPSFADRVDANGVPTQNPNGTQVYGAPPAKWRAAAKVTPDGLVNGCEVTKPGITASNCNNKLIGIRSYINPPATGTSAITPNDFLSGRDGTLEGGGGHGSHTLSTAGGNAGVPSTINGIDMGKLSGMAPRARLAMYKVCYSTTALASTCASSATVAAVNQAIKDGVDVINYSIGPTAGGGNISDPQEVAFLNASNAGIFVAAAAGNAGPVTGPASNLGPWHATVAASTHNRTVGANVIEGDGVTYRGASVNAAPLPTAPVIDARFAGPVDYAALTPQDQMARRLCYTDADRTSAANFIGYPAGTTASSAGALDPAYVTGKIVICDRGNNARVNKSAEVQAAGGIGMVLADNGTGLVAETHSVPTVHITQADGNALKAYTAANASPMAALTKAMVFLDTPAPFLAGFSSRGPNVADQNMLKPDIAAPGVDIVAAFSASTTSTEVAAIKAGSGATKTGVNMISGTSMASPHIAGLAALVKQEHPTWTPAMIKSALMTSAGDTLPDGVTNALPWTAGATAAGTTPFGQGAGQVAPNGAADPGLVYDAGQIDYVKLACGLSAPNAQIYTAATCASFGSMKAYALNLPSITIANILGSQTVTRTVTNVSDTSSTYTASAVVNGYNAEVTPASFTIAPGAKQTFSIKLSRISAPADTWAFGNLTWTDGNGHRVRSPISVKGSALVAPALVYSEATSGSKIMTVGTGFTGALGIDKGGIKAATRNSYNFTASSTSAAAGLCAANNSPAVKVTSFVVPTGTIAARFSMYNADTGAASIPGALDDFDMLVLNSAGTQVGGSLNDGSNESVTLTNPPADTYRVCMVMYDKGSRASTSATLSSWIVGPSDVGGAFKVLAPATTYLGGTASVGFSWSGLPVGQRYLGAVNYKVAGALAGTTLVDIQTNDPVPLAFSSKVLEVGAD
jgi:subtilisin family serine protease